jgi:hypothetical protein
MIELVFGDSAAGALKYAKSMKHGTKTRAEGVASGIIGESGWRPAEQEPKIWQGQDISGSPADVAPLTLALDIGDISGGISSRKAVLDMLFDGFPGYIGVADDMLRVSERSLTRLDKAKKSSDEIRIWLCEGDPSELCGLCFVCDFLDGSDAQVSVIRIPKHIEKDGAVINYRSTGEIDAEMFGGFVGLETMLSPAEREAYSDEWARLVRENAPLRAYINGALISVPEDFYDFAIRASIPEGEFESVRLIGKALIMMPGVGDRWLNLRINEMLKTGELVELSPTTEGHPYTAVLKRGKGAD